MEKVRRWITLALCLPCSCFMHAQEQEPSTWNLRTCIDYALRENITIQQKALQVRDAEIDLKSSKAALFPSLSASIGQRIVNRPNSQNSTIINGDDITTSQSKTSYNGSYGVDANWTLFNGNKRLNTIKQQGVNKDISELNLEESKQTLIEDITQTYLQILYATESVRINEQTLQVSEEQYNRGKELMDAGSLALSDLAQLKSQVSTDRYQLVTAQTTLQDYQLMLKQLLEIQTSDNLVLSPSIPEETDVLVPLPELKQVYQTASLLRPEIQAGKKSIESAQLGIKIARAGYLPSLSLSAGIGTNHANGNDFSFSEQVKQNWNNSLGLTISIPIFNNRQTKSAVQKARIEKLRSELQLQDEEKQLYKTIENLWYDARKAQQQYVAAQEKQESAQASFDLVSEQFNLGMKNTVELLTEKNNLASARQERLQAKYMALLNSILLKYYQGEDAFNDL
mgnify:FL=1